MTKRPASSDDPKSPRSPNDRLADETAVDEAEDEGYELDLDDGASPDLEDVFQQAVAAVDKVPTEREEDVPTGDEAAELRERLTRTMADFENFRKRTEREKESLRRYAVIEPIRDFLEVVDNIERAMASGGSAEDLKVGLQMIVRQLEDLLRRYGVEKVPALGQPFDPAVHEAVDRRESDDVEGPTVAEELQVGYRLHDRLIRPARVRVAMPKDGDRGAGAAKRTGRQAAPQGAAEAAD